MSTYNLCFHGEMKLGYCVLISDSSSVPPSQNAEDELCKICMDATIDCVLLECGHMISCTKCGKQLSECPMCRQYVVRAVHTFRS